MLCNWLEEVGEVDETVSECFGHIFPFFCARKACPPGGEFRQVLLPGRKCEGVDRDVLRDDHGVLSVSTYDISRGCSLIHSTR